MKEPKEYLERAAWLLGDIERREEAIRRENERRPIYYAPLVVGADYRAARALEAQALIALAKEIRETKRTTNDLA